MMLFTFILSALLSYVILEMMIRYSHVLGTVDVPNARKIQKIATPSMGGVALILSITVLLMMQFRSEVSPEQLFVLVSVVVLGVLSFIDDLKDLNYRIRLFIQFAVISMGWGIGFRIDDLHGVFGFDELTPVVSFILTNLFCMGLINAYNLIDGIDSLLALISIGSFAFFGYIFYVNGVSFYAMLTLIVLGFLVVFLYFNRNPAKIYMGDTGSMVIGFLLAILSIKLFNETSFESFNGVSSKSIFLAIHLVPAYDMVRVMAGRLLKRKSVFHADKTHVHHIFLALGWSVSKVALTLFLIHAFVVITAFFVPNIGATELLLFNIIRVALCYEFPLWIKRKEYKQKRALLFERQLEMLSQNKFLSNK